MKAAGPNTQGGHPAAPSLPWACLDPTSASDRCRKTFTTSQRNTFKAENTQQRTALRPRGSGCEGKTKSSERIERILLPGLSVFQIIHLYLDALKWHPVESKEGWLHPCVSLFQTRQESSVLWLFSISKGWNLILGRPKAEQLKKKKKKLRPSLLRIDYFSGKKGKTCLHLD